MFCQYCGTQNEVVAVFCAKCGKQLANAAEQSVSGPTPISGIAINNAIVWIVAFAPLLGIFMQYIIAGAIQTNANNLWFITLVLNIILCSVDDRILHKAGHDTKKFGGWVWLVPVYLYKRCKALNQSLAYFITWLVCFFFSLFL